MKQDVISKPSQTTECVQKRTRLIDEMIDLVLLLVSIATTSRNSGICVNLKLMINLMLKLEGKFEMKRNDEIHSIRKL